MGLRLTLPLVVIAAALGAGLAIGCSQKEEATSDASQSAVAEGGKVQGGVQLRMNPDYKGPTKGSAP